MLWIWTNLSFSSFEEVLTFESTLSKHYINKPDSVKTGHNLSVNKYFSRSGYDSSNNLVSTFVEYKTLRKVAVCEVFHCKLATTHQGCETGRISHNHWARLSINAFQAPSVEGKNTQTWLNLHKKRFWMILSEGMHLKLFIKIWSHFSLGNALQWMWIALSSPCDLDLWPTQMKLSNGTSSL